MRIVYLMIAVLIFQTDTIDIYYKNGGTFGFLHGPFGTYFSNESETGQAIIGCMFQDEVDQELNDLGVAFGLGFEGRRVTDTSVKQLGKLKNLKLLSLAGTKVDGSGLDALKGLTQLEVIDLSHCALRPDTLRRLGQIRSLSRLNISFTGLDSSDIQTISSCKKLAQLECEGLSLKDSCAKAIASLSELQVLNVRGSLISDEGAKHLSSAKRIRELVVDKVQLTDDCWQHFAEIRDLRVLSMTGIRKISGVGSGKLAILPHLAEMDVSYTSFSDDGLKALSKCDSLTVLSLRLTNISNRGITVLSKLSRLCVLDLAGCEIDDGCIDDLSKCRSLRRLNISGTSISETGIELLRDQLPACEILD